MKIAVLASRKNRSSLLPILERFKDLGIGAYALSIGPGWIDLDRSTIVGHLSEATHLVLVADRQSSVDSWFGYAVGYGTRLAAGLSLLRLEAAWDLPAYLRSFPLFENLDELSSFFKARKPLWEGEERRASARSKLFEQGIACTADSFASCASEGDAASVRLFLEAGFDPDTRDRHGVTMLCLAVRNRHLAAAEALLAGGASIDLKAGDRGYTPLMDAVKSGPPEHVAYFLERGADPNLESKDGQSALVVAVGRQDIDSARLLLRHGADADIPDKLGMSARSYARLFKLPAFAELFAEFPPIEPT